VISALSINNDATCNSNGRLRASNIAHMIRTLHVTMALVKQKYYARS